MRLIYHGLLWAVVLMITGCSGQTNQSSDSIANVQPDGEPNSSESVELDGVSDHDGAIAFNDTLPRVQADPPLLPPTSPDQRVAQVVTGRPDPFSPLPSSPTLIPATSISPQPLSSPSLQPIPLASLPNLPPPPLSTVPIPIQSSPAMPGQLPTVPGQLPVGSPIAQPPVAQPPAATLPAVQTVEVSGVVELGGVARAIVSVPNEGTGRSVSVGDRIANGQVLVKRIEVRQGGDPVVVLEQNGIEVVRSVSLSGG